MCIIIYEQWRRKLNYKKMYFNSAEKEAKTFLRVQKKFFFFLKYSVTLQKLAIF